MQLRLYMGVMRRHALCTCNAVVLGSTPTLSTKIFVHSKYFYIFAVWIYSNIPGRRPLHRKRVRLSAMYVIKIFFTNIFWSLEFFEAFLLRFREVRFFPLALGARRPRFESGNRNDIRVWYNWLVQQSPKLWVEKLHVGSNPATRAICGCSKDGLCTGLKIRQCWIVTNRPH